MPSVAFSLPSWSKTVELRQTAKVKAHLKGPQLELKGKIPGTAALSSS